MYDVNTKKIEEILSFIDNSLLPTIAGLMQHSREDFLQNPAAGFAVERIFHLYIEGMTDVGNFLIDGFIMRDPGSYEDIVDIMEDERVYPSEAARVYKELVSLRKYLVNRYTENIQGLLYDSYKTHIEMMEKYTTFIREYLKKELW